MAICKICNELDKSTRAYVNCAKAGGIVCMEHCSTCDYYMSEMGLSRCMCPDTDNMFMRKKKRGLIKKISPQSSC